MKNGAPVNRGAVFLCPYHRRIAGGLPELDLGYPAFGSGHHEPTGWLT